MNDIFLYLTILASTAVIYYKIQLESKKSRDEILLRNREITKIIFETSNIIINAITDGYKSNSPSNDSQKEENTAQYKSKT